MTAITESARPLGFLISEAEGKRSRENRTLLSGQNLKAGAVLGKIILGAVTSAAKGGGNTGNGTLTLDVTSPKRAGAKPGIYTVRCITAATNGGTFRVEDPDGYVLGDVTITGGAGGTGAFDDDIKFVLTDGGTDFAAGDGFDVTIAAGSGKVKEYNPANEDGSQVPCGILAQAVDASAADQSCLVVERAAEVNSNELNWFSGASAPQIATGTALLASACGIIAR
jgi:hypothetical protein